ncbi:MAG: efflux RND transporter permease subunit [Chloroflexota bacterium]
MSMQSLGRTIMRWRHVLLALIALVTVLSCLSLAGLETREDESTWMDEDDRARVDYDRFRELFGPDRFIVVAYETPDAFSRSEIEYLDYLSMRLDGLPHISEVTSLTTLDENVATRFGTVTREFLRCADAPCTERQRNELENRISDNPFVDGILISGDRHMLAIVLKVESTLDGETYRSITDALQASLDYETRLTGKHFYYGGGPVYDAKINAIMERDVKVFTPLVLLLSGVVLYVLFRSWRSTALTLLAVVLAMIWTFGLKAITASPVTPVSTTLVALIIIIGVANSVHFISHYRLELTRSNSTGEAMLHTFSRAGPPCFLTSLTTAIGFASLIISDIPLIRHLGMYAGFGIMSAFALTIVLLPAGLRGVKIGAATSKGRSRIWSSTGSFVVQHSRLVIIGWLVVAALVALGTLKLQVEPSMVEYLKPASPVRQAADVIDERLAGSSSIELLLEGPPGSFKDASVLREIDRLQNSIENRAHVAQSTSPVDFIRQMNGGRIPESDTATERAFTYLTQSDIDGFEEYYVAGGVDSFRVSLRTKQMQLAERESIIGEVQEFAHENLSGFSLTVTGGEGLVNEITVDVVRTQVLSVVIAVAVILALMLLFFGPRGAMAAILPNVTPIIILFGVMGLAGFKLNIATITVAAICIGLVVDDTIHYFSHFRRIVAQTGDPDTAAVEALHEVGTALAFTSFTLAVGFCVFTLSESAFLVQFGVLAMIALVTAFGADITMGPAILSRYSVFGRRAFKR